MKKNKKTWKIWCVIIGMFVVLVAATYQVETQTTMNQTAKGTKGLIVIDAGHGGFDPGKVGTVGTLEKEINLMIAEKLKKVLEDGGYRVQMTREDDVALCDEGSKRKKAQDLNARVKLINDANPTLAISIHQNSYSAGTQGAQVFYYANSTECKEFANILQETVKDEIGDGNHRVEKPNSSYFMLKNIKCPFAIIECGFLSNPQEEVLLNSDNYQQKMAKAIAEGIEKFLYNK